MRSQLREDRHYAGILPFVVLGLRRVDGNSTEIPVHVAPPQSQDLGWAAERTESTQRENQAPLVVDTRGQDPLRHVLGHREFRRASNGELRHVGEGALLQ